MKTLKGTQEKVTSVLGPLTKLFNFVEEECKILPANEDQMTHGNCRLVSTDNPSCLSGIQFNYISEAIGSAIKVYWQ